MEVLERSVKEAVHKVEAEPGVGDASWFAARQPGVIRYLEMRCGRDESMGVALMAALAIHGAFERALGVPPPRLLSSTLERAEEEVVADARRFVARQAALADFVAGVVAAPPVPLTEDEMSRLATVLATIVHTFDAVLS